MTEHPHAALVRRLIGDLNSGRMEAAADYVADDIEWHAIGMKDPIRGKEALAGMATEDYDIKYDLHDVIANNDHVVALGTATANRGTETLQYRTAEIMHVKDGKITQRWAFSDDTEAINRFFA